MKESHASSSETKPTSANRLKACFPVLACVTKLQISNVFARNSGVTGVETKLSMYKNNYVERDTPSPSPIGQVNRKADCWRFGSRCFMKRIACCNGGHNE